MFRITSGKGFRMTFENGLTISVQFGHGNYCANRNNRQAGSKSPSNPYGEDVSSVSAEVMVWSNNDNSMLRKVAKKAGLPEKLTGDGAVVGWLGADEVAQLIGTVSSYEVNPQPTEGEHEAE